MSENITGEVIEHDVAPPYETEELIVAIALWVACLIVLVVIITMGTWIFCNHMHQMKWQRAHTAAALDYRFMIENAEKARADMVDFGGDDSYASAEIRLSAANETKRGRDLEEEMSELSPRPPSVFTPGDNSNMFPLLRLIFSQFDTNKDGYVDAEELAYGLTVAGNKTITVERAQQQINNFNTDSPDGVLGPKDFIRWGLTRLRTSSTRRSLNTVKTTLAYPEPTPPVEQNICAIGPGAVSHLSTSMINDVVDGIMGDEDDSDSAYASNEVEVAMDEAYHDADADVYQRNYATPAPKSKQRSSLANSEVDEFMDNFVDGFMADDDSEDENTMLPAAATPAQRSSTWDLYRNDKMSPSSAVLESRILKGPTKGGVRNAISTAHVEL